MKKGVMIQISIIVISFLILWGIMITEKKGSIKEKADISEVKVINKKIEKTPDLEVLRDFISSLRRVPRDLVKEINIGEAMDIEGVRTVKFRLQFKTSSQSDFIYMDLLGNLFPRPEYIVNLSKVKHGMTQEYFAKYLKIKTEDIYLKKDIIKVSGINITKNLILGNKLASKEDTVFEFFDFTCTHCRKINGFKDSYFENNTKKRLVLIPYPLSLDIKSDSMRAVMMFRLASLFNKKLEKVIYEKLIEEDMHSKTWIATATSMALKELGLNKKEFSLFVNKNKNKTFKEIKSFSNSVGFIGGTPYFANYDGDRLTPSIVNHVLFLNKTQK